MKISYKHNRILKMIKSGEFDSFEQSLEMNLFLSIHKCLINYNQYFKETTSVLSTTYYLTARSAQEKLSKNCPGEYAIGSFIHKSNLCFYVIDDKSKKHVIIVYVNGYLSYYINTYDENMVYISPGLSDHYQKMGITTLSKKHNTNDNHIIIAHQYEIIYTIALFQKYAETETIFLNPKERKKDIDCKYINETDFELNILNKLYFTNISTSGFKVRGHFRLQPYLNYKKLIWIDEFQKNGYNRKCKKLN